MRVGARGRFTKAVLGLALISLAFVGASADAGTYDVGASDTTIKLGNTFPYSGPVSLTSPQVRQMTGYFNMINDQGGVNGRKIDFISRDDGYTPPKTVELTRELVEQDQVLAMFGSEGTPTQIAVQPYLNGRKVPQLFVLTGSNMLINPTKYPYTIASGSSYGFEGVVWAKFILATRPNAKIGIFYQADDFGSDHMGPFLATLGEKSDAKVVAKASYEITDPTVTSQILTLLSAGADTFVLFAQSRAAVQAISVIRDKAGSEAMIFLPYVASAKSVIGGLGEDKLKGLLSTDAAKDAADPAWADDPGVKDYLAFLDKYTPAADKASDVSSPGGFLDAQMMVEVLKRCGDTLTRAEVMTQASNLKHLSFPLNLPGIAFNTSPDNLFPLHVTQIKRHNGTRWELIGKPITE